MTMNTIYNVVTVLICAGGIALSQTCSPQGTGPFQASSYVEAEPGDSGPTCSSGIVPQGARSATLVYHVGRYDVIQNLPDTVTRMLVRVTVGNTIVYEESRADDMITYEVGECFVNNSGGLNCLKTVRVNLDLGFYSQTSSVPIELYVFAQRLTVPPNDFDALQLSAVLTIVSEPISMSITNTPALFVPHNSEDPSIADCANVTGCWVDYTATISPASKKAVIRFELSEVSRLEGDATFHCTGDCRSGSDIAPDYFFKLTPGYAGPPADGQSIETATAVNTATIRVFSRDYGGRGKLKAVATIDGQSVTATVQGTNSQLVSIPIDQDGNGIADSWERTYQATPFSPSVDEERRPIQSHSVVGDGFTVIQEYRGFVVGPRGSHKFRRLDPTKQDVFFFTDVPAIATAFTSILGSQLPVPVTPGIQFYQVDRELGNLPRVGNGRPVNRVGGNAAVFALVFKVDTLPPGVLGDAASLVNDGKPIRIDLGEISRAANSFNFPESVLLAQVVAHEAGHKLTLSHATRGISRSLLPPEEVQNLVFGEFTTASNNRKMWTRLRTYTRTDQRVVADGEKLFIPESTSATPQPANVMVPDHLFQIELRSRFLETNTRASVLTQRGFLMDWTPKLDAPHVQSQAWRFNSTDEEVKLCVRSSCP